MIRIPMSVRRIAFAFLLALPVFGQLNDQLTCIGPAIGIPASSGPPHWWNNTPAQPVYYQNSDDPRWKRAASITYGDGNSNILDWRGLQDATNIYMSWRLNHVVLGVNDNTKLFFGIERPAGDGGGTLIVEVNLKRNDAAGFFAKSSTDPGLYFELRTFLRNASGEGTAEPTPSWLSDTLRVWGNWTNRNEANTWAVQVVVPRARVAVTANQFKMWFQAISATPSMPVTNLSWPRSNNGLITQTATFQNVYPNPATADPSAVDPAQTVWRKFQFSNGPTDATCPAAAVSLLQSHIGATYPGSPHQTQLTFAMAGAPGPAHINTIYARPTNQTGVSLAAGALKARFRLANWGSSPMGWEDGVDPNVLWATIPGGDAVANVGTIFSGTTADATNEIRFNWQILDPELTDFRNGTRLPHQCLLVEMTGPAGLTFINASEHNNMNFKPASLVNERAQISIRSLPAIAPDGRDVYIWVETINMPAVVGSTRPTMIRTTIPPRPLEPTDVNVAPSITIANLPRSPLFSEPEEGKPIPIPGIAQLVEMYRNGEVTTSQLQEVIPSYIVHVYHDSGRRMNVGGVDRPVLIPQGSFGYYVMHEGDLYGFAHNLTGEGGITLEELAPDFYRVNKVPNDSVFFVNTSVNAMETAPIAPGSGIPWWVWLLIAIIVIIAIVLLLRKK